MPKSTFFRLPDEKRDRLMSAAVAEFTRTPFATASVSNIIQLAGIPRGSFYQYFEDKQDIFYFMLESFGHEMQDKLKMSLIAQKGDIFATMKELFDYMFDEVFATERGQLFKNVIVNMDFRSAAHTTFNNEKKHPRELAAFIKDHVDPDSIKGVQAGDLSLLMHVAVGSFMQTVTFYFNVQGTDREFSTEEAKRRVNQVVDWLQKGTN